MDTTSRKMYWNLHKNCWSVKPVYRGAKVAHATLVEMEDVRLVVQPAGRERVRREGKKNVHAYAKGRLEKSVFYPYDMYEVTELSRLAQAKGMRRLTYNPYVTDTFVDLETGAPVLRAAKVLALPHGAVWYLPEVTA